MTVNIQVARSLQLAVVFLLLLQRPSLVRSQCSRDANAALAYRHECASSFGSTTCGSDCSSKRSTCNGACGTSGGQSNGPCECTYKTPKLGIFGSTLENGEVSCVARCQGLATEEACVGQGGCKWEGASNNAGQGGSSGNPGGFSPGMPVTCVDTRESCQKCVRECKKVKNCRRARNRSRCKEARKTRCQQKVCNCGALDDRRWALL